MELLEPIIETDWGLDVTMKKNAEVNNSNFIEMITYVLNRCRKINKKRILVDFTTFQQKVAFMKLFEAVSVSQQMIGPGLKLAFVAPHLVEHDYSKFVEDAGFNRAIFIQYFSDKPTALEWLLK